NSLCALKVWRSFGKPNSGGVAPPAFALTRKPVPGVEKTAPRGELTLKKLAGGGLGSADASGTPSQLISRRRPPKEPFAPATVPPMSARNWSRAVVAAASPAPLRRVTNANASAVTSEKMKHTTAVRARIKRHHT